MGKQHPLEGHREHFQSMRRCMGGKKDLFRKQTFLGGGGERRTGSTAQKPLSTESGQTMTKINADGQPNPTNQTNTRTPSGQLCRCWGSSGRVTSSPGLSAASSCASSAAQRRMVSACWATRLSGLGSRSLALTAPPPPLLNAPSQIQLETRGGGSTSLGQTCHPPSLAPPAHDSPLSGRPSKTHPKPANIS